MPPLFERIRLVRSANPAVSAALRDAHGAWRRRFGDVVGQASPRLTAIVLKWGKAHGCAYEDDIPAWLFAVHTLLGIGLQMLAARAFPPVARTLCDDTMPPEVRIASLARGEPFTAVGVENLRSNVLGWYARDEVLGAIAPDLDLALRCCSALPSVGLGDTFRAHYESIAPKELRHALGETYTPDAFVARALDAIGWAPSDPLLDPTCGMGGFLIEALRRRLAADPRLRAGQALDGLAGMEINPVAVLAARVAMATMLADRFDPRRPARLPVYLTDAVFVACNATEVPWPLEAEDHAHARAVGRVSHIAGNPPWVKWSQLPASYASSIKHLCAGTSVLSGDRYVGGVEADVSALITHLTASRWLAPGGRMAFYLPASLFSTEAGEGFRRMADRSGSPIAAFERVEDLRRWKPFPGVSAAASLVLLRGGQRTSYPVHYEIVGTTESDRLLACPLPGTKHGPWLRGTSEDHALWARLFDAGSRSGYQARKGVTTDCNGVYFVRVIDVRDGLALIENEPSLGRKPGIERVRAWVEDTHLFPLMRGRGLDRFRACIDDGWCVLVPQRGMYGDDSLPRTAPRTWAFLRRFEAVLRDRGSYRRYQEGKPFWSVWSTGPYTFARWKVLWREMSGRRFCAAVAGQANVAGLGDRPVVPDHKLYFVPVSTPREAHYLSGILNAPEVARAVSSYAAQLSLGVSVIESLRIPAFEPGATLHEAVAELAARAAGGEDVDAALDDAVLELLAGRRPGA
jgi:hypothetical protein